MKTAPWNSPKVGLKILQGTVPEWGAGDATKTGRSVLKFSEESAQEGPGARKVPKSGKIGNRTESRQTKFYNLYY